MVAITPSNARITKKSVAPERPTSVLCADADDFEPRASSSASSSSSFAGSVARRISRVKPPLRATREAWMRK